MHSSATMRRCFPKIRSRHPDEVFGKPREYCMGSAVMKFILVNHRTPLDRPTCAECSRSLASGYLKAVSTRRQYCDYDCYARHEARDMLAPWLAVPSVVPFELITSFVAASCSYSIALAKAALRAGELATAAISEDDRRRRS